MIDDYLKEQASLYVVGALPTPEARAFEESLGQSLELQLLVAQLRGSAEALVSALPRRVPSPALRARLLAEVDRRGAIAVVPPAPASALWLTLLPWGLAASLAFACVVLMSRERTGRAYAVQLEQRLSEASSLAESHGRRIDEQKQQFEQQREEQTQRLRQQVAEQQRQFAGSETKLVERIRQLEKRLGDPVTRVGGTAGNRRLDPGLTDGNTAQAPTGIVPAAGVAGGASAPTVLGILRSKQNGVNAIGAISWDILAQRGLVVVDQMPAPTGDKDYQLWLIVENNPVNAGVLKVDASGKAQISFQVEPRLETVDVFAITLEAKGGVPSPQGAIFMASN